MSSWPNTGASQNEASAWSTSQGAAFGVSGAARHRARPLRTSELLGWRPFKYLVPMKARRFAFHLHREEKVALFPNQQLLLSFSEEHRSEAFSATDVAP